MALYVIRARESGHYYAGPYIVAGDVIGARFDPDLGRSKVYRSQADVARIAEAMPYISCDVLELRPVYRDEAAQ